MDWIETGAIGERIMEQQYYDDIWNWKLNGMLPSNLPSTASNFRATAAKYYVCHVKNILMRNGKIVLRKEQLPEVWKSMHFHSGRDKTWQRIK